jgi:hypothetical protein
MKKVRQLLPLLALLSTTTFSTTTWLIAKVIFISPTYAFQSKNINATIRISVCGDGVAENPEECDVGDMKSATCRSLGFDTGSLTCDIACELDKTDCVGVAPSSPTPTPAPTLAPASASPTVTPTSPNVTKDITQVASNIQVTTPFLRQLFPTSAVQRPKIPEKITFFLQQQSDTRSTHPYGNIVKSWVDEWREYSQAGTLNQTPEITADLSNESLECDVNEDGLCNLVDFSVLLYFIEPIS